MEFDQDSAHTPQPALDSIANYVSIFLPEERWSFTAATVIVVLAWLPCLL
jgi:hypothetical protein